MKIVILDAGTLGADIDLSPITVIANTDVYKHTTLECVAKRVSGADVIVVNKIKLNKTNLENARNLKLICVTATGYDNIDTAYCSERGIAVCNIAGYSTDSVAQLTAALALSLSSHLVQYREFVHSGAYSASGTANSLTPVWHELSGKVWGIVGGGAIGSKVAEIATALGCKVIVFRRKTDPVYKTVDIDTLCKNADIISIHIPLTDETRGIISRERIAKMKDTTMLINVARGAVCDENALADAIMDGKLGALGIDVYSVEPMPYDHPFYRILDLPNVCLTPHTAWGSFEARSRCVTEVANNIIAFIKGETRNRIV